MGVVAGPWGGAHVACPGWGGRSALRAADLRARLPTWKGRGCRQTILAVAARASRPTWGNGAGSGAAEARDASLRSSSLGSCRTSRRAHEASRTSCGGRGHGTARAVAHLVQLPTWGTGPAPAHPEPETPARRLQLGEHMDVVAGPWGGVHVASPGGAVVHYGPRTSWPGCQLGRTEEVIRHYGLWPPGLADRLGVTGPAPAQPEPETPA